MNNSVATAAESIPSERRVSAGTRSVCNVCGQAYDARNCERARVRCNLRRFADQQFHVWRCSQCRCLHCEELVDLDFYYRDYGTKDQRLDFFSRLAYGRLCARLRRAGLRSTHRLLDYGCGSGNFVTYLRERGFEGAIGYDPYGGERGFGDASILQRESFDFVNLQDVIEHVEDPNPLMAQLAGLLKPGGVLLVGTPSADEIDLRQTHRHLHQLHMPYHLHLYTRNALVEFGRAMGLSAERFYRRFYMEMLFFGMNEAFCRAYLERLDDNIESLVEPPHVGLVLRSPTLLFHGTFGYLYSPRHSVTVVFRKSSPTS